jgi:rare lipoprotein A
VRTAKLLDFYDRGTTRVRVDYVGRAALEGSDDTKLAATLRSGTPAPDLADIRVASSRPFLPQSAALTREAIPIPTDRPFNLGHDETAARVANRQSGNELAVVTRQPIPRVISQPKPTEADAAPLATASVTKPEQGFAARFSPTRDLPTAPTGTASVSAFAGPGPNGAVMTGRGLY